MTTSVLIPQPPKESPEAEVSWPIGGVAGGVNSAPRLPRSPQPGNRNRPGLVNQIEQFDQGYEDQECPGILQIGSK